MTSILKSLVTIIIILINLSSCGNGNNQNSSITICEYPSDSISHSKQNVNKETLEYKLEHSYDYDGKEIEMTGVFKLESFIIVQESFFFTSFITLEPDDKSKFISKLKVKYGTKKNNINYSDENIQIDDSSLSDGYKRLLGSDAKPKMSKLEDIEIFDNNGHKLAYDTQVKVKGRVVYTSKGPKTRTSDDPNLPDDVRAIFKESEDQTWGDGNDYSYEIQNIVISKVEE